MVNKIDLYTIILIVAIFTVAFRLIPVFINIPEDNKFLNTFFDILPIAILSVLAIPDIFTSIGKTQTDISIACVGLLFIIYLTYKKKSLAVIALLTTILVIALKEATYLGGF